jgi:DNA-binding winged helix-turn-helix (wHTH) protein
MLATRLGEFITRDAIARALRSPDGGRSADVHIYRIRKKLRELAAHGLRLDTVHGRGYCLSLDAEAAVDASDAIDDFNDPSVLGATARTLPPPV